MLRVKKRTVYRVVQLIIDYPIVHLKISWHALCHFA